MFQPVPETMVLTLIWRYDAGTRDEAVDFMFQLDGGWTDGLVGQVVDAAAATAPDTFEALTPSEAKFLRAYGRDLELEFAVGHTAENASAGTNLFGFAPPNTACWVKFSGTSGFPPRDGGIFYPFVAETEVGPTGLITADWRDDLDNAVQTFIGAMEGASSPPGGDSTHVIVSRFSKTAWLAAHPGATEAEILAAKPWKRDGDALTSAVTAVKTRELCGSQRDRRG